MQRITVGGSPAVRYLIAAAAVIIVVFGLKFSSDFLAPVFFAATLAILFSPALRWLEKRGLPTGLALLVLILGLGGFIVVMIVILSASLQQLALRLPVYQALLHQRIDSLGAALGNVGVDLQGTLNAFVADTASLIRSALNLALGVVGNGVSVVFFLSLLFLMLAESKSIAGKFQARLQAGNSFVLQLGNYSKQIQKQYRIQALSNLLSAVAIMVELLLFRVDFAVLWGFLAFVLGFIPNIGLILATLPALIIALILYGWGTALAILVIGIILNAAMDNAVTPRIMGKGLDMPVLLIFLSFLFWSWVFGFVGALLAIPATLFVKTLLQGRQETRFLVVLLSRSPDGAAPAPLPHASREQGSGSEEGGDQPGVDRAPVTVESTGDRAVEEG